MNPAVIPGSGPASLILAVNGPAGRFPVLAPADPRLVLLFPATAVLLAPVVLCSPPIL